MIDTDRREVGKELATLLTIMIKDAAEAGLPAIAQSLQLALTVIRYELGESVEEISAPGAVARG